MAGRKEPPVKATHTRLTLAMFRSLGITVFMTGSLAVAVPVVAVEPPAITGEKEISGETDYTGGFQVSGNLKVTNTGVLKLGTATGTFQSGSLTIDGVNGTMRAGILGASLPGDTMGGTVNFESGFGDVKMTAGAGITVGVVDIAGGSFSLEGKGDSLKPGSWRTGTMIQGDQSVTMSNGTLNLGSNAMMLVGYSTTQMNTMTLSGGTINMLATDAGNAALLRASSTNADKASDATNGINGINYSHLKISGTKISVGDADNAGHGVIASRKTDMSAGELNINGSLIIAGSLNEGTNLTTGLAAAGNQSGEFNLSGGKIHLNGTGTNLDPRNHLEFYQSNNGSMAFNQSGGQVILDGTHQGLIRTDAFTMSGGELTMSGGVAHALGGSVAQGGTPTGTASFFNTAQVSLDGGSLVQVKDINISGGTFEVKGKLTTPNQPNDGAWRAGSALEAAGKLDMSGGTVNLGSYGQMLVHYGAATNVMTLNGEAVVNLQGDDKESAALLRASTPALGTAFTDANPAGKLVLNEKATINVVEGKYGVIAAQAMDMQGGTLNVGLGSVLEMSAQLNDEPGAIAMTSGLGKGMTINGTKLNMSGGTLNVANDLTIKNQSSSTAPSNIGALNMTGGTTEIKGKLTVDNNALLNVGTGTEKAVLSAGSIDNKAGPSSTVGKKGVVTTSAESFLDLINGEVKNALKVDGVLNLSYQGEAQSVTITEARNLLKALAGTGSGSVNILDNKLVLAPGESVDTLEQAAGLGNLTAGMSVSAETGVIDAPAGNTQVKNIVVKSDENATLTISDTEGMNLVGGGSGTQLIATQPGKSASIIAETGGTITLGSEATNPNQNDASQRTSGNLSGNITATGGTINFINIASKIGAGAVLAESPESGIITAGNGSTVNISNASVSATRMVLADTSEAHISNGSTVSLGSLEGSPDALLTVGDSVGAGRLAVLDTNLKGMRVFIDPAWQGQDELNPVGNASQVALVFNKAAGGIDGLLTTGRNALLVVGTPDTAWATKALQKGGITWGPNHTSAALALYGPQTLAALGGLTVNGALENLPTTPGTDPSLQAVANTLYLGKNSLLAVHVPSLTVDGTAKAALTATDATAHIDPSAQLLLVDAAAGKDILILEGFKPEADSQGNKTFKQENIRFDNFLLQAVSNATLNSTADDPNKGKLTVKTELRQSALDDLLQAGLSASAGQLVKSYMTQENPVTNAFMESALSSSAPNSDAHNLAMRMEAGLDVARAADAQGSALTAAQVGANTVLNRAGGALAGNGLAAGSMGNVTFNIWAMPLFAADSVKAAVKGSGYKVKADTTMFGGVMGGDIDLENARVGAAFTVGTGNAKAKGNGVSTKNKLDYIGGSVYGATTVDNVTISAMAGYTSVKNSITQTMASGDQLKASPKAQIWNMGIRMEYDHALANNVHIIPSIGVDWVRYSQDAYHASMAGTNVLKVESASNNQVSVPIGVKVNTTIALANGATITPEARLRYIPTFGSRLDSQVSLANVPTATATLNGADLEKHTGEVGLGLSLNLNANLTLSAAYDFQFSKSRKAHRVNALLKYNF